MDVFIQDLYRLVEHCEYGELCEQLLGDRIVVGVSDDALSDRLQAQVDLTLARQCRSAANPNRVNSNEASSVTAEMSTQVSSL